MTRRLSVWFLRSVIARFSPFAPAGVQEWGQAMLREMEFVQGSWSALGWAVGAARSYARAAATAPMAAASDVPGRLRMMERSVRQRTRFIYAVAPLEITAFAFFISTTTDLLLRLAFGLIIAAMLYAIAEVTMFRGAAIDPAADATPTWPSDFRRELTRQSAFHAPWRVYIRLTLITPPLLLLVLHRPHLYLVWPGVAVVLALALLGLFLNRRMKLWYERQIEALDTIFPQGPHGQAAPTATPRTP